MNVYIHKYERISAGGAIYQGYYNAWQHLGYEVKWYTSLSEINDSDYILMTIDHDVVGVWPKSLEVINNARRAFCFCNATWMPDKFNLVGYYVTVMPQDTIDILNKTGKVKWFGFGESRDRYGHNFCSGFGEDVISAPLAFDNFTYLPIEDDKWKYDVCFVGGYVNNGIFAKERYSREWIMNLEKENIKCGFFGMDGRKLSIEDEVKLLYNSKIALNVHDEYQRLIGSDYNEREIKSIGINGFLITDSIWQSEKLKLPVIRCKTKEEFKNNVFKYLSVDNSVYKRYNRKWTCENHAYTCRVKALERFI